MAERTWQDVCREITKEHDSERLLRLIEELNRSLEKSDPGVRAEPRVQELR